MSLQALKLKKTLQPLRTGSGLLAKGERPLRKATDPSRAAGRAVASLRHQRHQWLGFGSY